MELLKRRTRLDPEFLDERAAGLLVGLKRLRLAARAVEREHELTAQPFAKGVLLDERLELAGQVAGAPGARARRRDALRARPAAFLEPRDLTLRKGLVGEIGQRRAAPELEALSEKARPGLGVTCPAFSSNFSNRWASTCCGSTASEYPGGRVTTDSAPRALRSCEIAFCSDVGAVRGGSRPRGGRSKPPSRRPRRRGVQGAPAPHVVSAPRSGQVSRRSRHRADPAKRMLRVSAMQSFVALRTIPE